MSGRLDFCRGLRVLQGMSRARMTLSLLLMVLILPWGAYVNAASARTNAGQARVTQAVQARSLMIQRQMIQPQMIQPRMIHAEVTQPEMTESLRPVPTVGRDRVAMAGRARFLQEVRRSDPFRYGPNPQRVSSDPSPVVTNWLTCRKAHLPGSVCGPHVLLPGEIGVTPPEARGRAAARSLGNRALQLALPPPKSPPRLA